MNKEDLRRRAEELARAVSFLGLPQPETLFRDNGMDELEEDIDTYLRRAPQCEHVELLLIELYRLREHKDAKWLSLMETTARTLDWHFRNEWKAGRKSCQDAKKHFSIMSAAFLPPDALRLCPELANRANHY